jgi:hypothetical protein
MRHLLVPFICSALTLGAGCASDEASSPTDAGSTPDAGSGLDAAATDGGGAACALGALPAAYPVTSSVAFAQTVAAEGDLHRRFAALKKLMEDAEKDAALRPTEAELGAAFTAGAPSLREATSSYSAGKADAVLRAFALAVGHAWNPTDPPAGSGGRFGGDLPAPAAYWIFDERGIDLRQAWEKASFGALHFHQARRLIEGPSIDGATVDRVVALFGAGPARASDGTSKPAFDRGTASLSATYAKRRDDPARADGLLRRAMQHAIHGRVAAEKGSACADEARSALNAFSRQWEEALFATVIYYANAAKAGLQNPNATVKDQAAALHALGEGVAFAHGFRQLPAGSRHVTDAQIDEILALFGQAPGEAATTFRFVTDPLGTVARLDQITDKVRAVYGFTDEQVASFRQNF